MTVKSFLPRTDCKAGKGLSWAMPENLPYGTLKRKHTGLINKEGDNKGKQWCIFSHTPEDKEAEKFNNDLAIKCEDIVRFYENSHLTAPLYASPDKEESEYNPQLVFGVTNRVAIFK